MDNIDHGNDIVGYMVLGEPRELVPLAMTSSFRSYKHPMNENLGILEINTVVLFEDQIHNFIGMHGYKPFSDMPKFDVHFGISADVGVDDIPYLPGHIKYTGCRIVDRLIECDINSKFPNIKYYIEFDWKDDTTIHSGKLELAKSAVDKAPKISNN